MKPITAVQSSGDKGFEDEAQLLTGLGPLVLSQLETSKAQPWKREDRSQRYAQPITNDLEANGRVPNF